MCSDRVSSINFERTKGLDCLHENVTYIKKLLQSSWVSVHNFKDVLMLLNGFVDIQLKTSMGICHFIDKKSDLLECDVSKNLKRWMGGFADSIEECSGKCQMGIVSPMKVFIKKHEEDLSDVMSQFHELTSEAFQNKKQVEIDHAKCLEKWNDFQEKWTMFMGRVDIELDSNEKSRLMIYLSECRVSNTKLILENPHNFARKILKNRFKDNNNDSKKPVYLSKKLLRNLMSLDESRGNVEALYSKHRELVERSNETIFQIVEFKLSEVLTKIEELESTRNAILESFLSKFLSLQEGLCDSTKLQICSMYSQVVSSLFSCSDFIDNNSVEFSLTISNSAKRSFEYELPCNPSDLSLFSAKLVTLLSKDVYEVLENMNKSKEKWTQTLVQEQLVSASITCAVAIEPQVKDGTFIGFRKGDVIRITNMEKSSFWKGFNVSATPTMNEGWMNSSSVRILNYDSEYLKFEHLIQVPYGLRLFRLHLSNEHSDEELDFLLEIDSLNYKCVKSLALQRERFKLPLYRDVCLSITGKGRELDIDIPLLGSVPEESEMLQSHEAFKYFSNELTEYVYRIYNSYILESGDKQVNISYQCRKEIIDTLENCSKGRIPRKLFIEAGREIYFVLKRDSYSRFTNTKLFQEFLLKMKSLAGPSSYGNGSDSDKHPVYSVLEVEDNVDESRFSFTLLKRRLSVLHNAPYLSGSFLR